MPLGPNIFFNAQNKSWTEAQDPPGTTLFGASGSTVNVDTLKLLGAKITRARQLLTDYHGSIPNADNYIAKGYAVVINLNVADVGRDPRTGDKVPNPFMTDLDKYRKLLEPVVKDYAQRKGVLFAIENEPTTGAFNSGPMSDYLALLEVAVDVVHQYGGWVMDGGVHTDTVLGADSPWGEGKAAQVAQLLAGYKNIALDNVNLHTRGTGNSYPAGSIKKAMDKIYNLTGHVTGSNEWHTENGTENLIKDMVGQWRDAGALFSIYISISDADKKSQLNDGNTLTTIGEAYKSAIA
jgi:hypothetical protein